MAPSLSLDALIDQAITATGYDLALLIRPGGRRRMANVRKLMRLGTGVRGGRGSRPQGVPRLGRLRGRDLTQGGRGHHPGGGTRRRARDDDSRLEGPRVPSGRRCRPGTRAGRRGRRIGASPGARPRGSGPRRAQGRPATRPPRARPTLHLRVPGAGRCGGGARPGGGTEVAPRGHDPRRAAAHPERGGGHGGAREGALAWRAADGRGAAGDRVDARKGQALASRPGEGQRAFDPSAGAGRPDRPAASPGAHRCRRVDRHRRGRAHGPRPRAAGGGPAGASGHTRLVLVALPP